MVVALADPKHPQITAVLGSEQHIHHPVAMAAQFRYAFVCDAEGVKVLNITDVEHPCTVSHLDLPEAHNIYVARTYAYVAGGSQGLVILDIENPEQMKIDQVFNAGGCINDVHDVKLVSTVKAGFQPRSSSAALIDRSHFAEIFETGPRWGSVLKVSSASGLRSRMAL